VSGPSKRSSGARHRPVTLHRLRETDRSRA
jgi:hypothetical protein